MRKREASGGSYHRSPQGIRTGGKRSETSAVQEISREKLIAASREAMSRSRRADQTAGLSRSKK